MHVLLGGSFVLRRHPELLALPLLQNSLRDPDYLFTIDGLPRPGCFVFFPGHGLPFVALAGLSDSIEQCYRYIGYVYRLYKRYVKVSNTHC